MVIIGPPSELPMILVAGEEPGFKNYLLNGCDSRLPYRFEFVPVADSVIEMARPGGAEPSLVLLDTSSNGPFGLQTLETLHETRPDLPVIALSNSSSTADVVSAIRSGAVDFLAKPASREALMKAIQKALESKTPERGGWQPGVAGAFHVVEPPPAAVVGAWNQKLELLLERIGVSDVPVLLHGETGVGKEMLARRLHARSSRAGRPFLKLNCAALPSELVESELFGYEKGAFTGAVKSTPGKFEVADKGTILLDEIGDMDFKLQAKLLQVVQDHEFIRLGSTETTKVDVRVFAATHCDLELALEEGRFREDLYYRLNIVDIHIPPLRERTDEIIPLAEYFIHAHATHCNPALPIPREMREALLEHHWPGNIRELENVIRKFLVLRCADMVVDKLVCNGRRRNPIAAHTNSSDPRNLPARVVGHDDDMHNDAPSAAAPRRPAAELPNLEDVDNSYRAAEMEAIMGALESARWNRKQAAELLKIDYKALLYRMKKLGIGEAKAG